MKKANVKKLESLSADFLQYRYEIYLIAMKNGDEVADLSFYKGACKMIDSIGGQWKRNYSGDNSKEQLTNIENYSHIVWFPTDTECENLNMEAWK